jgi:protein-S-isoprenylcysteine O-methyltransferase Ste14
LGILLFVAGLAIRGYAIMYLVALLTLPTFLAFSWRIRVEEAALLDGLGTRYQAYMDRTKRLIPGIY